jgi:hypothetical protein
MPPKPTPGVGQLVDDRQGAQRQKQERQVGVGQQLQQPAEGAEVLLDQRGAGGPQGDGVAGGHRDAAAVQLLQQFGAAGGQQVDRVQPHRLLGGDRAALADGVDGELFVAAALGGDGLGEGGGVVDHLVGGLAALQGDRGGGADGGAWRHRREVGGHGDQRPRRGGASTRGGDVDDHWDVGAEERLDDLPHGGVQPARGV